MFKLESEQAVLKSFRSKDRKLVELSREVKLPAFVRHYLAWSHPSGGRVYLVFAPPGGAPIGIAFDRNSAGPPVPHMCDWCHTSGLGAQVGLLTAKLSATKTVGVHVCSDLGCGQRLEDEADRSGENVLPAMERLLARMARFSSEGLRLELTADRR